jgi:hypothetical protein
LYKKRDRYKEELSDYFKQEAKERVQRLDVSNAIKSSTRIDAAVGKCDVCSKMTTPQLQIILAAQSSACTDCTTVPSSIASTGNKVCYPVDDITRLVTCTLVIRYGINNNRTKKVGTGIAIPGRKFHGSDIPDDYCRVEVMMVVQGSEDGMLDIPGPEGIETLGQAIKNFILWPQRDVELVDPPTSSSSHPQPSPPPQTLVPLHPPPSPQPSRDSRQSKKSKFPLPKLVSTFEKKKSKATTAGTAQFLKGIGWDLMSRTIDLAEHEESAEKAKAMAAKIKIPTKADYKNVPKHYVLARPLLTLEKLRKVPTGIKRLHDWYMRASSVSIEDINVHIPDHAFIGSDQKAFLAFDDMWLMMNLQKLDVQVVTLFAL